MKHLLAPGREHCRPVPGAATAVKELDWINTPIYQRFIHSPLQSIYTRALYPIHKSTVLRAKNAQGIFWNTLAQTSRPKIACWKRAIKTCTLWRVQDYRLNVNIHCLFPLILMPPTYKFPPHFALVRVCLHVSAKKLVSTAELLLLPKLLEQ